MPRLILALSLFSLTLLSAACGTAEEPGSAPSKAEPIKVAQGDWPWWRGTNRNGVGAADQQPPVRWSETQNVVWKVDVPGRGHGSPTVVGTRVFLAIAEEEKQVQAVICYERSSGKPLWRTDVHQGGFDKGGNPRATQASSTVACDGTRIFISFLNKAAIYTTALSLDGKQLWQTKITDYVRHQGYGSSPAIYKSLVIISADNKGEKGGAIAALDRVSGKIVWKNARPAMPNYPSPIILPVAGKEQLLLTGCELVSSFDPLTGKKQWEIEGATTECVTSTVTDGELIFTSGGYPRNHTAAVRADGSGKIVWENKNRVYVPSMLVHEGYLYATMDAGTAGCWKCSTGEEMWKHRLGGKFYSSPVLVGENIYANNEQGKGFVFKASPKAFEMVAENELGDSVFATPAICGGRIYTRVASRKGSVRQETLYCLGRAE
ncbi:MAG: serine/threonine protein kinase [Planctomycetaceae bacterium]|nr:serine/threonine protein kinase [Planctomycetaceae bacterium]